MNNNHGSKTNERKSYRILLVIVGLAAFSSALHELNQLKSITREAGHLIAAWSDVVVPTASASFIATACEETRIAQNDNHSDEFRWSGNVAPGLAIEVAGINGEIVAEPTSGSEVQVIALKRSRRTDVSLVQLKVVQHAGGVTICALYPNEDGEYPADCGRGDGEKGSRRSNSVRNNDVRVDFKVSVPQRVGFIGRTINGDVSATALTGNVNTSTINGSIKISTTGYCEASTINGQISASMRDANWPSGLSFKTINGEINLSLPANLSASVDAQTLNGGINSDFPLNVTTLNGHKSVKGTIGAGGRELMLRTLNGSINLRSAGNSL
ncbi:MAG: hypothetical protein DMF69_14245 [Acidobacteria bacterium]|nr:MAG: hypothetical protein DMF69_14245 [Acidobacteriota bacterium]